MNKKKFSQIFIAVFGFVFFVACSTDDDSNTLTSTAIQTNISTDSWRITRFVDSGFDETNDFANYVFTFNSSGSLTATNGTNTYTGTWSITSDDDVPNDIDLNILFNLTNDFEDLNEDWDIISNSATKIELRDDGVDYLTFERN